MHQPMTTDVTPEGLKRARNAMREKLKYDPAFAHRWLCHPERGCEDGCDTPADPSRVRLYQTDMEK